MVFQVSLRELENRGFKIFPYTVLVGLKKQKNI
jgi:hypothetical protein